VKKRQIIHLDFEIDKLTNSIVNTFTGDSFETEVTRLTKADLKTVTKKIGWSFNWAQELKQNDRDVYKLTIVSNPTVIQGLISFTIRPDNVFMHLVESSRQFGRICMQDIVQPWTSRLCFVCLEDKTY
jgi:hypothetical protein